MAITTRNQIYDALVGLAAGMTFGSPPVALKSAGRRPRAPDKLRGLMPCLRQGEYGVQTVQQRGMPQKRILEASWIFYHLAADDDLAPATTTADILDTVDRLFPPADGEFIGVNGGPQTLGGLVNKVWIEGRTEIYGGNIDAQVIIVVPLLILWP